jgi:hypothetical protein
LKASPSDFSLGIGRLTPLEKSGRGWARQCRWSLEVLVEQLGHLVGVQRPFLIAQRPQVGGQPNAGGVSQLVADHPLHLAPAQRCGEQGDGFSSGVGTRKPKKGVYPPTFGPSASPEAGDACSPGDRCNTWREFSACAHGWCSGRHDVCAHVQRPSGCDLGVYAPSVGIRGGRGYDGRGQVPTLPERQRRPLVTGIQVKNLPCVTGGNLLGAAIATGPKNRSGDR